MGPNKYMLLQSVRLVGEVGIEIASQICPPKKGVTSRSDNQLLSHVANSLLRLHKTLKPSLSTVFIGEAMAKPRRACSLQQSLRFNVELNSLPVNESGRSADQSWFDNRVAMDLLAPLAGGIPVVPVGPAFSKRTAISGVRIILL